MIPVIEVPDTESECQTVYHAARSPLDPGALLKGYQPLYAENPWATTVRHALDAGPHAVEALMLTDRLLNLTGHPTPVTSCLIEHVVENVRAEVFPTLRPRFGAVFVWQTLGLAIKFAENYHQQSNFGIYECRILSGATDTRDMSALPNINRAIPPLASLEEAARLARNYWAPTETYQTPETLVFGEVVVVRRVR